MPVASDERVDSYDGFRMDSVHVDANTAEISGESKCSHCAKPMVLDIPASVQAKMDFLELVEEEKEK